MTANLHREPLTAEIMQVLATTGRPIGRGVAPSGGGWQGQPNATGSNFIPYCVLQVGPGSASSGPFDDPQADWQLGYTIWGFGVRTEQCESISDEFRNVLSNMTHQTYTLGDQQYSVQQVRTESIGPVNRYDQTDPPYWGEADAIMVWITKER